MPKHFLSILVTVLLLTSCNTVKLIKILNTGDVSQKDFSVRVPYETRMDLLIVKVKIKGKTYDFIADTGAPNVLSKELAAELGLKPKVSQTAGDSQGGSDKLDFVTIDSLSINGLTFTNTGAAVANLKQSNEIACLGVDGFIGSNLMKQAIWQIDYDKQEFTIVSSMDKLQIPEEKVVIPFKPATSGTPKIELKYNNVTEHNVTFDTGSNGSFAGKSSTFRTIMKDSAGTRHNSGFGRNASGLYGNNTTDTTYYAEVNVGIGNAIFAEQLAKFKTSQSSILGNAFLKSFRVIIDWSEQQIFLIQNHDPGPENPENFGFSPSRDSSRLLVSYLISNSAAEKAGIRSGDQIMSINGIDYSILNDELWCGIMYDGITDKDARSLTLEILHEGVRSTYTLEKEWILK